MAKTIRFGDLVRESGRPEAVTLWTDPRKDRSFSKAVKENRVITIHSDPGSHRKDYGQIGFHEEKGATYLVFPRALPKNTDSRVIGINYHLAEDAAAKGPLVRDESARKPPRKAKSKAGAPALSKEAPPKAPESMTKNFQVLIRRTAVLEEMQHVKATSEHEARDAALNAIKHKRFALNRAIMREEVISVAERK